MMLAFFGCEWWYLSRGDSRLAVCIGREPQHAPRVSSTWLAHACDPSTPVLCWTARRPGPCCQPRSMLPTRINRFGRCLVVLCDPQLAGQYPQSLFGSILSRSVRRLALIRKCRAGSSRDTATAIPRGDDRSVANAALRPIPCSRNFWQLGPAEIRIVCGVYLLQNRIVWSLPVSDGGPGRASRDPDGLPTFSDAAIDCDKIEVTGCSGLKQRSLHFCRSLIFCSDSAREMRSLVGQCGVDGDEGFIGPPPR